MPLQQHVIPTGKRLMQMPTLPHYERPWIRRGTLSPPSLNCLKEVSCLNSLGDDDVHGARQGEHEGEEGVEEDGGAHAARRKQVAQAHSRALQGCVGVGRAWREARDGAQTGGEGTTPCPASTCHWFVSCGPLLTHSSWQAATLPGSPAAPSRSEPLARSRAQRSQRTPSSTGVQDS